MMSNGDKRGRRTDELRMKESKGRVEQSRGGAGSEASTRVESVFDPINGLLVATHAWAYTSKVNEPTRLTLAMVGPRQWYETLIRSMSIRFDGCRASAPYAIQSSIHSLLIPSFIQSAHPPMLMI